MPQTTVDDVCEALAAEHRRLIIDCIDDRAVDIETLADEVARSSEGPDATVALHHCHLPKLERHDVVERDGDRVAPGPLFSKTRWILEALRTIDE